MNPSLGGSVATIQGLPTLLQMSPTPSQLVPEPSYTKPFTLPIIASRLARALRVVNGGLSSVCDPWTVASEPPMDGFTGVYESRHSPSEGRPDPREILRRWSPTYRAVAHLTSNHAACRPTGRTTALDSPPRLRIMLLFRFQHSGDRNLCSQPNKSNKIWQN